MEQEKLIKQKNKLLTGFTIIELIIVIAIIAVLAGIVTTNVMGYTAKAKIARAKVDAANIEKALQLFYTQYGDYPNSNCPAQYCGAEFYSSAMGGEGNPYLIVNSCDPSETNPNASDYCPHLSEFYNSDWAGYNANYFVKNGFYRVVLWDDNNDGKIDDGLVVLSDDNWHDYGQKYILCTNPNYNYCDGNHDIPFQLSTYTIPGRPD